MAHHKSAIKRIRQNEKKKLRNQHHRSTLRSTIKIFEQAIQDNKIEEIKTLLRKTLSMIGKAASKGVIPKNTASRQISRLTKKANAGAPSSS